MFMDLFTIRFLDYLRYNIGAAYVYNRSTRFHIVPNSLRINKTEIKIFLKRIRKGQKRNYT